MGNDKPIGLEDAYGVDGPEDNRNLYGKWARTYDETFVSATGYRYHERVAHLFRGHAKKEPILDVGCGTGVVGVELRRAGFTSIDGIDISPAMLEEAAGKEFGGERVYRRLLEGDLTASIDLPSDTYPGLISAGTFTHGHLGPESLGEVFRVAASGAVAVIGVNSAHFGELEFDAYLDDAVGQGTLKSYEIVEEGIYDGPAGDDPDRLSNVVVASVA